MSESLNVEDEMVLEEIPESKVKSYLKLLKEKNLIGYGKILTQSNLEELFGQKKSYSNFKEWNLFILCIREIIKAEGYFITSRGFADNFYILEQSEMASENEKKNRVMMKNLKQRRRALNLINPNSLSDNAKKKLEFEILKNGHLELEMQKSLSTRCRY